MICGLTCDNNVEFTVVKLGVAMCGMVCSGLWWGRWCLWVGGGGGGVHQHA